MKHPVVLRKVCRDDVESTPLPVVHRPVAPVPVVDTDVAVAWVPELVAAAF
jgi:hypothetical protein